MELAWEMLTVMRSVLDGGEGVIRGGSVVRSSDRFNLFLDDRRLDVGVWSGVSDEADDNAVILAASVVLRREIVRGRRLMLAEGGSYTRTKGGRVTFFWGWRAGCGGERNRRRSVAT
jgi:hypothetical protein